jgi:hypothetical protein
MQIKNIQFRQSGGFAGLVRGAEVSADEGISETERRALERHAQGTRAVGEKTSRIGRGAGGASIPKSNGSPSGMMPRALLSATEPLARASSSRSQWMSPYG